MRPKVYVYLFGDHDDPGEAYVAEFRSRRVAERDRAKAIRNKWVVGPIVAVPWPKYPKGKK